MAIDHPNTVALLHYWGADASQTFLDESGKSWTAVGSAQIDTAQYKFGSSSGLFNGTTDQIKTAYTTDFNFNGVAWTIDTWFRCTSFAANRVIISKDKYGVNWDWGIEIANSTTFNLHTNGYTTTVTGTVSAMSTNTWYHIAYVHDATNINMYLNGTNFKTQAVTITNNSNEYLSIGSNGWNSPHDFFPGHIAETRVMKGIAFWTANFTPSTSAYGIQGNKTTWFFMQKTKRLWDKVGGLYIPRQQGLVTI